MTVYLVGAGPGDPGLLTRRGAELLAVADVVVYDRLIDASLLLLARRGALLVDVGKSAGAPGTPRQQEINQLLCQHGRAGNTVVRLKGGDPFLFGRGGEEAEALDAAGLQWEVVPGVTSAFAVPGLAGTPVTHRGLSTSVTVATGQVGDQSGGEVDWESLGRAGGTLVILMGMATRGEIADRLMAAGRARDTPVLVSEWGSTPRERSVRTTLDGLAGVQLGSPAVIVVGPVAGLDLGAHRGPLSGATVVVTRRPEQAADTVAALGRAGARVVELPVIEIDDPADGGAALRQAAASLDGYRWVVFTSSNAVDRLLASVPDVRTLAGVRLAAVGPSTAAALARHRLVADLVAEVATGEGLVAAFANATEEDRTAAARVLFPCAEEAGPSVPDGLNSKGWEVHRVVAYRTVVAAPPPDEIYDVLASADAVTFASPSSVRGYLELRTTAGRSLPIPTIVACVGPVTARAARAANLEVGAQASSPTPAALVDALIEVHRRQRAGGTPSVG